VNEKFVEGWDDPRMPTVRGFRRRGYTAEAINSFCEKIGVTRNAQVISFGLLEQCLRDDLDMRANRAMVVTEPLRVVITNWKGKKEISVPNHPKLPDRGSHDVPFTNVLYIEKSDFRLDDVKGYKRLAPGQTVGLLHCPASITCTSVVQDKTGAIQELHATVDWDSKTKPRGYIHWVSRPEEGKEPLLLELRLFDHLFNSEQPATLPKETWLQDINKNSLTILHGYADPSLTNLPELTRFQFERVGYFAVDKLSTQAKPVWNRITSLKEAKWEGKDE